jgi:hypothetical protein
MKIDRHSSPRRTCSVKHHRGWNLAGGAFYVLGLTAIAPIGCDRPKSVAPPSTQVSQTAAPSDRSQQNLSQPRAVNLLRQVLDMVVHGPAFDAKVRETVWTTGREVVGVGTYEQAGGGSGRFNLQLTMHDGDGKHRLQQISDGRLAWTRSEIAGHVALRRVDVGRLDQWVKGETSHMRVSPGLRVGAWAEMLSTIERDFNLRVDGASLKGEAVWVISGILRSDQRDRVRIESGREDWPMLHPTRVRVAIKSKPDPKTGFGQLLPIRIEYWSDAIVGTNSASPAEKREDRLITLIELYSIRPISAPSAQRFRFENQDAEVNFTNETDRYIQLYGVQLTQRELLQLRR